MKYDLTHLVEGDRIVFDTSIGPRIIRRVLRVTPTQLVVQYSPCLSVRIRRADGYEIGTEGRDFWRPVLPVDDVRAERARDLRYVRSFSFDRLANKRLANIARILKGYS